MEILDESDLQFKAIEKLNPRSSFGRYRETLAWKAYGIQSLYLDIKVLYIKYCM